MCQGLRAGGRGPDAFPLSSQYSNPILVSRPLLEPYIGSLPHPTIPLRSLAAPNHMISVRTAAIFAFATIALASLTTTPTIARDARAATTAYPVRSNGEATYATGTVIVKIARGVANTRSDVMFGVPSLDAVMDQIGATKRTPLFPLAPYTPYEPQGPSGTKD